MHYVLPALAYDYDSLSPFISSSIMELHHKKHHQGYVDKLNGALVAYPEFAAIPLSQLLVQKNIPDVIRNNGGGHYNHSLFWQWMSPGGGGQPGGKLGRDIAARYGSFQAFVNEFSNAAGTLFGSGWVWLLDDLGIVNTSNQDTPMRYGHGEPLLGLDVWEHAYYLDYKNVRSEYIHQWWNVVNWDYIAAQYDEFQGGK